MASISKQTTTVSKNRLLRILNILSTGENKDITQPITITDKIKSQGSFSPVELTILRGSDRNIGSNGKPNIEALKSDLLAISAQVTRQSDTSKAYQSMTPEIKKARNILIPSIMSPTDMYGEQITVGLECPNLDDKIKNSIAELITEYMNNKIKIGKSIAEWIGEAMFDTGAAPVLILPKKSIKILTKDVQNNTTVLDDKKENKYIDTCTIGTEAFCGTEAGLDLSIPFTNERVVANISDESLNDIIEKGKCSDVKQKIASNLSSNFNVSFDFRKVSSLNDSISKANKAVDDKLKSLISTYGNEKVYTISDDNGPNINDEPIIHKLPANSVIPIHVPGSPKSHIGYFIIVDEYGNPIDGNYRKINEQHSVGSPFLASINSMIMKGLDSPEKKYNALSSVFELTLKKTLSESLKSKGIDGIEFPESNNLYSCIFSRAMANEKITLVYVTSSNLAYFAYDFREDGTGKGIMEDSNFIIAMRTAFLIARVITALNNSTDKKKITFDMDDNQGTNVEQIMGMIKDAYINKNMYNLDHNPMTVMRDIVSRSISVVPSGMKGISDLKLETTTSQGQANKPDDGIENILTNFIVTTTNVPHAALNELGENEFSRSITTTNLLFANYIRGAQTITCSNAEILVKAFVRNSSHLLTKIIEVLKQNKIDIKDKSVLDKYLNYIIGNIFITLPSPTVSPNKARYKELEDIIETIIKVVGVLLPEDLIVGADETSKSTILALKADVTRKMVKDTLNKLGASGFVDTALIDKLDIEAILSFNEKVGNISNSFKMKKASLDKPAEEPPAEDTPPEETNKW